MDFTGEFFVPGKSNERIEADHMERYRFACRYAHHKTVLDIACGVGYSAPLFCDAEAISYEGVDLNDELVAYANQTYASEKARFHAGNVCTYRTGKTYDIIVCYETIEHVPDYRSALSNLHNLLSPGGLLLISSPNRPVTSPQALSVQDKPENEFHEQEFTPDELLRELQAAGFTATPRDIYGQRQRRQRLYTSRYSRRMARIIFGDPDTDTSPVLTPMKKAPRYFVIVAGKQVSGQSPESL